VAASLRKDPSITVELVSGHYGEFTVLVDGKEALAAGPLAMLGVLPSVRQVREVIESRKRASQRDCT
jgi:hypothetical protein